MPSLLSLGQRAVTWVGVPALVVWLLVVFGTGGAYAAQSSNMGHSLSVTSPQVVSRSTTGPHASGSSELNALLQGRTVTLTDAASGAVLLTDLLKKPIGPLGDITTPVTARASAAWPAIAKGVGRALPIVGTALAVKDLLDAVRCKSNPAASAWECDDGQPEVTTSGYCNSYSLISNPAYTPPFSSTLPAGSVCAPTVAALCQAVSNAHKANGVISGNLLSVAGTNCSIQFWSGTASSGFNTSTNVNANAQSYTKCPDVTINGVVTTPTKGADGKCATNTYTPADENEVPAKVEAYGDKSKAGTVADQLSKGGVPFDVTPLPMGIPSVITGPEIVTTKPDGTQIRERTDYPMTANPDGSGYSWSERRVEIGPGGTTTTDTPTGAGGDVITCGLPNTPPCKIDETGTPTLEPSDGKAQADGLFGPLKSCVTTPSACLPALPALNWAFTLPSTCVPWPMPAFAPVITQIDVCQFQPVIHDLMSLVWAAAGLFAGVSMVFRDASGGA